MATTTTTKGNFVQVTWTTALTDWVFETEVPQFGKGMKVKSIQFNPSAASDVCVIREGSLTGPKIFEAIVADATDNRVKYFGEGTWMKPYIEADDLTANDLTTIEVVFELA